MPNTVTFVGLDTSPAPHHRPVFEFNITVDTPADVVDIATGFTDIDLFEVVG